MWGQSCRGALPPGNAPLWGAPSKPPPLGAVIYFIGNNIYSFYLSMGF